MTYFEEIYGYEALPKPSVQPKAEPVLPFEDWRWQDPPPVSSEICNKVENMALVDAITGESVTPESALQDFPGLEQFRKVVPLPVATPTAPVASDVMQKRAPEYRHAISDILAKFKAKLGGPKDQEPWSRLQRSCENYLHQALMEVT